MPISNSGTYVGGGLSTHNAGSLIRGQAVGNATFPAAVCVIEGLNSTAVDPKGMSMHVQGGLHARSIYSKQGSPSLDQNTHFDEGFNFLIGKTWEPSNSLWVANGTPNGKIPPYSENTFMTNSGSTAAVQVVNASTALNGNPGHLISMKKSGDYISCGLIKSNGGDRTISIENGKGGSAGIVTVQTDSRNISQSLAVQDSTCSTILNVLSPKLLELQSGEKLISFEFGAARTSLATVATESERGFFRTQLTIGEESEEYELGTLTDANGDTVEANIEGPFTTADLEDVADRLGGVASDYTWTGGGTFRQQFARFDEIRLIPLLVGAHKANRARLDTIEGAYATQAYVDTAVGDLVDAAPGTLDTLNELAAALGDDANFASTVTTSIGTKLDASAASAFGLTLIDDADAAAARTTLGLGTAATTASTDYATAAQGTTADAALPSAGAQAALSVDHLITLSGVAESSDNLGTFTGSILSDNLTVKAVLQEIEDDLAKAIHLDGVNMPGPYNNDADAGTGGVPVGGLYKNNNGTVHWRVS